MGFAVGIVIVMGCVFGGYILAGGKIDIILYALPFELMMIGGGATGGFIIGNKGSVIKKMGKTLKKALDPQNILNPGKVF